MSTDSEAECAFGLVEDESEVAALEPDWRELAVSAGNAFLTPEWYALSRLILEPETKILVATASKGGKTIGVLPLVRPRRGSAHFAGADLGDRFGPLLSPAAPPDTARNLLHTALSGAPSLSLSRVIGPGPAWGSDGGSPRGVITSAGVLPMIEFGRGGWKDYLASQSRNFRSQVGRRRRKLESAHDVNITSVQSPGEAQTGMAHLFRLHAARWSGRSERSRFDREDARTFHAELAPAFAERGWLRLMLLHVDQQVVAAWYGWRLGDTVSYYQAGFDPAWADQGVGGILFAASVEAAAAEGAVVYDMLLGDESFKLRWANRVDEAVSATLGPMYSRGVLEARARRTVLPLWRALPASFRSRVRS